MRRSDLAPPLTVDELRQRVTVDIPTAARFLGISPDLAYDAARRNELPVVAIGRRRLVLASKLLAMVGLD